MRQSSVEMPRTYSDTAGFGLMLLFCDSLSFGTVRWKA